MGLGLVRSVPGADARRRTTSRRSAPTCSATTYKDVNPSGFTLTRLHARYGKDIKDDLVFRAVAPIAGGRGIPDADGKLPQGLSQDGTNNFQGRYVIQHPWTGEVACASPHRGEWGGPPAAIAQQMAAQAQSTQPQAARNLAFVPRGNVQLASLLTGGVPEIGLLDSKGASLPAPVRQPQGCGGCAAGDAGAGASGAAAMLAAIALVTRRRRQGGQGGEGQGD